MPSEGKPRALGKSRGGITTKIHLLCNSEGMPMDFCITGGNISDIKTASGLTDPNKMKCLIADKAYGSKAYSKRLDAQHIKACIPPKSNEKNPAEDDETFYKLRHIIENMYSKIKDWKGVAFRGNRCTHSFVAFALIFIFFNDNKA